MLPALLLAAALFDQAAVDARVASEQLCASAGTLYGCADAARTPVCYDTRRQLLVPCSELPADKDGTLRRALWIVGGNSFDILTTGVALNRGGTQEGNGLIQTPEIRWGAKGLTAVVEIGLVEFTARVLRRPKLALWIARGLGAAYGVVGFRNLRVQGGP